MKIPVSVLIQMGKMPIYLLTILIIKDKRVIMIITIKKSEGHFYSYFLIKKFYFYSVLNAKVTGSCFTNCAHFL